MILHPYLHFQGDCRDAFEFYRSVFGGEFVGGMTYGEIPPMEGVPPPTPEYADRIINIALPIGPHTTLMGSDAPPFETDPRRSANAYSILIAVDSQSEADRIFHALSQGGSVTMPIGDAFWGAYFGMCTDRFGTPWMISFDQN